MKEETLKFFAVGTTSILLDSPDDEISSDRLLVFLARSFTSWLSESFGLQSPNGGSV